MSGRKRKSAPARLEETLGPGDSGMPKAMKEREVRTQIITDELELADIL